MRALYYIGDRTMEMRDIPRPAPMPGYYLVKVKANGICGSDVEGFLGKTGRRTPPMIMGHEVSGIIEQSPEGGRFAQGTRVVIFPKPFCGTCGYCTQGLVNVCQAGICMGVLDAPGSMTEYLVVEEKYLLPFADHLSYAVASMTEPLAVAYRSVSKISDEELARAKHIMVIGAGTIGLLALALLKMRGARHLLVSDTSDFRLGVAKSLGAECLINPLVSDPVARVREATDGHLCDICLEAVGIQASASTSLDVLRLGGTAIWIGNAQKMVEVDMQRIVTTELVIRGNYVYDFESFAKSLRLLEERKIQVEPLLTHTFPLEDGVEAFRRLENNRDGKMLKVILES